LQVPTCEGGENLELLISLFPFFYKLNFLCAALWRLFERNLQSWRVLSICPSTLLWSRQQRMRTFIFSLPHQNPSFLSWPLPSSHANDFQIICKDFQRGHCARGKECRYVHTEDPNDCRDFKRGKCTRGSQCRFRHVLDTGEVITTGMLRSFPIFPLLCLHNCSAIYPQMLKTQHTKQEWPMMMG
jgi:hypothetical protein